MIKNFSGVIEGDPDLLPLYASQTPDSPVLQADIMVAKQVSKKRLLSSDVVKKALQKLVQINEISEITYHACEAGKVYSHFIGLLGKNLSNLDGSLVTSNEVVGTGVKSMREKLQEYERQQNEMVSKLQKLDTNNYEVI